MITVPIPPHIARALIRRRGVAEPAELPRSLSAARGDRIAAAAMPPNMLAQAKASEAKAWNHSPLAGILWEHGFRASIACQLAETVDP